MNKCGYIGIYIQNIKNEQRNRDDAAKKRVTTLTLTKQRQPLVGNIIIIQSPKRQPLMINIELIQR